MQFFVRVFRRTKIRVQTDEASLLDSVKTRYDARLSRMEDFIDCQNVVIIFHVKERILTAYSPAPIKI